MSVVIIHENQNNKNNDCAVVHSQIVLLTYEIPLLIHFEHRFIYFSDIVCTIFNDISVLLCWRIGRVSNWNVE